jgi:hypothetical protein
LTPRKARKPARKPASLRVNGQNFILPAFDALPNLRQTTPIMNVSQIINAADAKEVARLYALHWAEDDWADLATFLRFKTMLNAAVGVNGAMRAVVAPITDDEGTSDGIGNDTGRYDVSGDDGSGTTWSLSFSSWSDWKLMEVVDRTTENLPTDMLAMNLYYEMTWYGWPEEMLAVRDEVFDRAEAVERGDY